jgi:hypothetical protein
MYTRELRLLLHFMETLAAKTNVNPGCYNSREPMLLITMGTLASTAPGSLQSWEPCLPLPQETNSHRNPVCYSPRKLWPLQPWEPCKQQLEGLMAATAMGTLSATPPGNYGRHSHGNPVCHTARKLWQLQPWEPCLPQPQEPWPLQSWEPCLPLPQETMAATVIGTLSATAPGNHGRYIHGNPVCHTARKLWQLQPWEPCLPQPKETMAATVMGTLSATTPGNHGRYSHGNPVCHSPRKP